MSHGNGTTPIPPEHGGMPPQPPPLHEPAFDTEAMVMRVPLPNGHVVAFPAAVIKLWASAIMTFEAQRDIQQLLTKEKPKIIVPTVDIRGLKL